LHIFSRGFTFFIYTIFGYRKKVVFKNLRNAFPEKHEQEIKQIAKTFYKHLSSMIVENMFLRFASSKKIQKSVIVENIELFEELSMQGKNVIAMVGHLANWEFGSGVVPVLPFKGAVVYKKLSSAVFDKIYFEIRQRLGVTPVEMNDVFRMVVEWNKKSEPYLISMVADQAPLYNEKNHWITFLNQETNVYVGSEKIARKFDIAVVYIELIRLKNGVHKITPFLITANPKETKEFEITERYFQLLEKSIKKNPPYWLWSHRRWKHKRILPNKGKE
jgi:KDO2-lipid IV(A) lauroyltransferase